MPYYRKKPIPVIANQWFPQAPPEQPNFDQSTQLWTPGKPRKPELHGVRYCPPAAIKNPERGISYTTPGRYVIDTLEGPMNVTPGDWIIVGIQGERYPVKDEIFRLTYELAKPTDTTRLRTLREFVKWWFSHDRKTYKQN